MVLQSSDVDCTSTPRNMKNIKNPLRFLREFLTFSILIMVLQSSDVDCAFTSENMKNIKNVNVFQRMFLTFSVFIKGVQSSHVTRTKSETS